MHPRKWRELVGKTLTEVAEELSLAGPSAVEKYERGFTHPSPAVQIKYEQVSDGAVTAQDWIDLFREAQANPPQRRHRSPREAAEAPA